MCPNVDLTSLWAIFADAITKPRALTAFLSPSCSCTFYRLSLNLRKIFKTLMFIFQNTFSFMYLFMHIYHYRHRATIS